MSKKRLIVFLYSACLSVNSFALTECELSYIDMKTVETHVESSLKDYLSLSSTPKTQLSRQKFAELNQKLNESLEDWFKAKNIEIKVNKVSLDDFNISEKSELRKIAQDFDEYVFDPNLNEITQIFDKTKIEFAYSPFLNTYGLTKSEFAYIGNKIYIPHDFMLELTKNSITHQEVFLKLKSLLASTLMDLRPMGKLGLSQIFFDLNGIKYEKMQYFIKILPEKDGALLNRLAYYSENSYGTKILYAPLDNQWLNAFGYFSESKNLLSFSDYEVITLGLKAKTILHEMRHAQFFYKTNRRISNIFQGELRSIGPTSLSRSYKEYLSFEEVYTHISDLNYIFKDLKAHPYLGDEFWGKLEMASDISQSVNKWSEKAYLEFEKTKNFNEMNIINLKNEMTSFELYLDVDVAFSFKVIDKNVNDVIQDYKRSKGIRGLFLSRTKKDLINNDLDEIVTPIIKNRLGTLKDFSFELNKNFDEMKKIKALYNENKISREKMLEELSPYVKRMLKLVKSQR